MTTDLSQAVGNIASAAATPEYIADVMGRVEAALERAKAIKAALKEAVIQHILATGRDLTIGDIRWYVREKKKERCLDVRRTIDRLLVVTGGDMDAVCGVMVAQPFKFAAARKLLPDYDELFETTTEPELCDGVPKKELCSVDTRFIGATNERHD
jgi:hypothetical protein